MERGQSTKIRVWVNGTFDVLHRGHVELLNFAGKLGIVRVGVDTDDRVKKLKGPRRPVNNLEDRMYLLKNIKAVESVVTFSNDEELENQIKLWSPEYIIIGSDHKNSKIFGKKIAKEIIFFDRLEQYSSTKIIEHEKGK